MGLGNGSMAGIMTGPSPSLLGWMAGDGEVPMGKSHSQQDGAG